MTILSRTIPTARLAVHVLERPAEGPPAGRVLLVHGNVSSSEFFRDLLQALPAGLHVVAPDLRGYGLSDPLPLDATRGLADFADDLHALMDALGWAGAHLLGWSLGGGVVLHATLERPSRVHTLTLVAPISPYGFGGTHGERGTPNAADFAGSGGGTVNAAFVAAIRDGDRSDAPGSPRDVLRNFYVHAAHFTFPPEREDALLNSMLQTRTGDDHYPGDATPSAHWPHTAPGTRGVANAFSPRFMHLARLADLRGGPPILWVRGEQDAIIGDASPLDLATLGQRGLIPGWPGDATHPPQPMLAQTRAVLAAYARGGAPVREVALDGVGHAPFLEAPAAFLDAFTEHLSAWTSSFRPS
ncbi:alpha/beta hydrolase [Deinococcus maricopensis]|uniref:Alpha/beta hydrolase fold protein n=1 Tax=Deinococcus maricopensis (strain DSM 21211 / LMG 22137 / NRRL B-23946 / LB-34) TaxID=709986 RepID=E8UAT6_DEIML|nr:alpha/beta hydrolase [Deinococcus maricopensis]ADV68175.1 alpha/beta hydrolase fold protein [Deinococcus maricopensis DSM 21211]